MFQRKHNAKYYVISKMKDCCTLKAETVARRKCHGSHSTFIGKSRCIKYLANKLKVAFISHCAKIFYTKFRFYFVKLE